MSNYPSFAMPVNSAQPSYDNLPSAILNGPDDFWNVFSNISFLFPATLKYLAPLAPFGFFLSLYHVSQLNFSSSSTVVLPKDLLEKEDELKEWGNNWLKKKYPYLELQIVSKKKYNVLFKPRQEKSLQLFYKENHPYFKIFFSEWQQYHDKTFLQIFRSLSHLSNRYAQIEPYLTGFEQEWEHDWKIALQNFLMNIPNLPLADDDKFTLEQIAKLFLESNDDPTATLQTLREKFLKDTFAFSFHSIWNKIWKSPTNCNSYFGLINRGTNAMRTPKFNDNAWGLLGTLLIVLINITLQIYQALTWRKKLIGFQEKTAETRIYEDSLLTSTLLESFRIDEKYKDELRQIPPNPIGEEITDEILEIDYIHPTKRLPSLEFQSKPLRLLRTVKKKPHNIAYFGVFFFSLTNTMGEISLCVSLISGIATLSGAVFITTTLINPPVVIAVFAIALLLGICFAVKKILDRKKEHQALLEKMSSCKEEMYKLIHLEMINEELAFRLEQKGIKPRTLPLPKEENTWTKIKATVSALYRSVTDFLDGCSWARSLITAVFVGIIGSALAFSLPIIPLIVLTLIAVGLLFLIARRDSREAKIRDEEASKLLEDTPRDAAIEKTEKEIVLRIRQCKRFSLSYPEVPELTHLLAPAAAGG